MSSIADANAQGVGAVPDAAVQRATARRTAIGIAVVLLAQLMIILDSTIVAVALPDIAADLDFGPAALSWVLNSYILAFGGLLLLGGRLGDVLGRRRMFAVGLAVFTLFSLLSGLAQTSELLIAARALQGVGGALAAPQVLALLVANAATDNARNRAIALFSSVSAAGGTLGYVLGGLLTDAASWRWTLFINVPLGLLALASLKRYVAETSRERGRFDFVGAITVTGAAVLLVWALTGAPSHGWASAQTIGGFVVATILLAVFFVTESRVAHPLLRLGLLASHERAASLAATFTFVGSQIAMYFILVQFMEIELGYSAFEAGLAFVPLTLGVVALSPVVTKLMAWVEGSVLMTIGALTSVVGFLWLTGLGDDSEFVGALLGPMLLFGAATALMVLPAAASALAGVEPEHTGTASGLFQTMQQLGGAMGLAVIASVYAANAVPGQFLPGVKEALIAGAILSAITGLAALTLTVRRRPSSAGLAAAR